MTNRTDIERLFRSHFVALHSLATHLLHDEEAARDAVCDVFASLLDREELPAASAMQAYLLRAVRNRCVSQIRSTGIHERFLRLYSVDVEEIEEGQWPDEETLRRLDEIIGGVLTPQCRRVVLMRFRQALTYRQIAEELQISDVAVYKHLRHALDVLRQHFPDHDKD